MLSVAHFEGNAVEGAVDFQGVSHGAFGALYFFDFVVVGVGGGIGQVVGCGYADEVGKNLGMAFRAVRFEAHGAALQVGERGGLVIFLLNPHGAKGFLVKVKGCGGR